MHPQVQLFQMFLTTETFKKRKETETLEKKRIKLNSTYRKEVSNPFQFRSDSQQSYVPIYIAQMRSFAV